MNCIFELNFKNSLKDLNSIRYWLKLIELNSSELKIHKLFKWPVT